MSGSYAIVRQWIPGYVRDAISDVANLSPGRGIYRTDRLRVLGEFILQASSIMAGAHNDGRAATAAALRRLADKIEAGEDAGRTDHV